MSTVSTSDFELPLPDGWSDRTTVTLTAPVPSSGYAANLVVTREQLCDHMGLGAFASGHLSLLAQHASELAVVRSEDTRIGGERAIVRLVRFRVGDQPALVQLQALLVRHDVGYAIVGTATEADFAEVEPQLRSAIDGFDLRTGHTLAATGAGA